MLLCSNVKSADKNSSVVCTKDVGRILRTFKIKKNVEVTDNGKIII
ncbi:helicase [Ruminococcus sp. AM27-16]|nr:helicase [Ruminococcus sp. AM27-16]